MTGAPSFFALLGDEQVGRAKYRRCRSAGRNVLDEADHAQSSFLSTWPRSKILALYYPPPELNNIHFKY